MGQTYRTRMIGRVLIVAKTAKEIFDDILKEILAKTLFPAMQESSHFSVVSRVVFWTRISVCL